MRLKSNAKVRVVGYALDDDSKKTPGWSLSYFLQFAPHPRGTVFDLDVLWGKGKHAIALRLVGVAHTSSNIRWYLTTVPRELLTADHVIQGYRLRWLVELLFREIKQAADLGRSFTADKNAVEALTYGAMLAHVLVRSLRIQAALANEVPLEQLRPLACLHVARAFAREIVDSLASLSHEVWSRTARTVTAALLAFARELKPSRSRMRIALTLGAVGA
jgi:hypothetical protein